MSKSSKIRLTHIPQGQAMLHLIGIANHHQMLGINDCFLVFLIRTYQAIHEQEECYSHLQIQLSF